jgi:hypothetical protein
MISRSRPLSQRRGHTQSDLDLADVPESNTALSVSASPVRMTANGGTVTDGRTFVSQINPLASARAQ